MFKGTKREDLFVHQISWFSQVFDTIPVIGKKYRNPLRIDNNPGCFFKYSRKDPRVLLFIDNAYPQYTGDALKLLRLAKQKPIYQKVVGVSKSTIGKRAKLNCTYKKYPTEDFIYFYKSGNIDIRKEKHRVKQVSRIFYEDNIIKPNDLCISYIFEKGQKLYRPFNKKYKWSGNASGKELWGFEKGHDKYFFTSSSKDVLTLEHNVGIKSFCTGSENASLDYEVGDYLRDKCTVIFDNDETGRKAAKKLKDQFGFDTVFLSEKDPYDLVKKYGQEKLLEECHV